MPESIDEEVQSSGTENQLVVSENNYQNNTSSSNYASTSTLQISFQPVSDHVPGGSRPKRPRKYSRTLESALKNPNIRNIPPWPREWHLSRIRPYQALLVPTTCLKQALTTMEQMTQCAVSSAAGNWQSGSEEMILGLSMRIGFQIVNLFNSAKATVHSNINKIKRKS
ncbi:uncharacterized protein LOC134232480 [Saccostrea cucullata]|uniref:uncharacterized protein LOC134232480 n=1 Tax=Saccostrea cuccullata TaxID=36930 RepID=UPI002ED6025B